jgi:hypothetical protein
MPVRRSIGEVLGLLRALPLQNALRSGQRTLSELRLLSPSEQQVVKDCDSVCDFAHAGK